MKGVIIKYLGTILILIISVIGIFKFNKKIIKEDKLLIKSRYKTWCKITNQYQSKSGQKVEALFYFKNKSYVMKDNGYRNGIKIGTYYTVAIDTIDIENNPIIDWSEQRIMPDTNNIYLNVYNFKIDRDTTPMGWNEIHYTYHCNNKYLNGIRYIKNQLLIDSHFNSLKCIINKNEPENSYLFWPKEMPLFCE